MKREQARVGASLSQSPHAQPAAVPMVLRSAPPQPAGHWEYSSESDHYDTGESNDDDPAPSCGLPADQPCDYLNGVSPPSCITHLHAEVRVWRRAGQQHANAIN